MKSEQKHSCIHTNLKAFEPLGKWMDKIKELAGCERMNEMLRLDEDRSDWRAIVASINIDTALRVRKGKCYRNTTRP